MTNTPDQEAEKVARENGPATNEEYKAASSYATSGNRGKDMPSYGIRIKAHVAGQRVGEQRGYLRALEEVNDEILKIGLTLNNDTLIKLGTILTNLSALNNLKSKGGA